MQIRIFRIWLPSHPASAIFRKGLLNRQLRRLASELHPLRHRPAAAAATVIPSCATPHIDPIARGTAFDHFYVASPVCMPNRSSLMTGRMPSVHGVRCNGIRATGASQTDNRCNRTDGCKMLTPGRRSSGLVPLTTSSKKFVCSSEFHTWTEDEIAQFQARWRTGTTERMAFALLLYTGQRRSDVVRMSWRDIDGDIIRVTQKKTNTKLEIPLHPDLKSLLADWPKRHLLILTTSFGKPFTATGFGNWMAYKIAAAGLPDKCVTHGLRKAAARRLADAGCSTLMIMAVTGHQSLKEVERYTKAEQRRPARAAIGQLPRRRENKD